MPFTIPEIYVGQVVSGEAVLTNAQIDTQINPAPLAQTPTYNPSLQPINPEWGALLLQPQLNSKPTSFKQVCQDDMHNGVPVKECFLMPVYEEQTPTYNPPDAQAPTIEDSYERVVCENGREVYVDRNNLMFLTPNGRDYIGRYNPYATGRKCSFEYQRA